MEPPKLLHVVDLEVSCKVLVHPPVVDDFYIFLYKTGVAGAMFNDRR